MSRLTERFADSDYDAFLIAKEALDISEYQLFIEAHRFWYGEKPSPGSVDKLFDDYLHSSTPPFFVRHFSRHFVTQHPDVFQLQQDRQRRSERADLFALIAIALIITAAMLLG